MAKTMKTITGILIVATATLCIIYHFIPENILLTLIITAGTTLYHFAMRLCVGVVINNIMHNRADYTKAWYQLHLFEKKLYKLLRVKSWKQYMPAYQPDLFDIKKHSLSQIAQATCQAEIVHEVIILLSFVPLLCVPFLGSFWVFFLTSLLSAGFDLCFVMIQRYNRPRIIKCIKKNA